MTSRTCSPAAGVTEFLVLLARPPRTSRVAVITPEYTETMRFFSYADFHARTDDVRDTPGLRLKRLWAAMRTHDHVVLSNPSNPLGHYLPRAQLI
ncbi:hypothetical protein [Streptomyces halstedii]|uniref:Aminotransferase class I/II-fold pyridoxal phosphate-dependent enzyme n=1 Tax=Streptomyces halstedii TaxID=1944 RepID=A0A6N9UDN9_STRHA|nr:hypothetical protein [Streptomyces halstedii]NEA20749.1 hypothetical protein [Streptomyces halstedii]